MLKGSCILLIRHRINGYGYSKGANYHNVIYKQNVGEIPKGMVIHHLCENKSCINPDHLVALTRAEHMRIHGINNGNSKKTVCKEGHPFDRWSKKLGRHCSICLRKYHLDYYHKNKGKTNPLRNKKLKLKRKENI